jgi:two-component system chemotaxis response regulator CheB
MKIKVLITDDSVVYRSQIRASLADLDWIEVVGAASNGRLALEKMQQMPVDLLILDLEMPEMDGITTLREINQKGFKVKVLVFSSVSQVGSEKTLEALKLGACDFITKPDSTSAQNQMLNGENPSVKIKAALEPRIRALFPSLEQTSAGTEKKSEIKTGSYSAVIWDLWTPKIVVLGSSTGGPTVLEKIFGGLRGPLKCPVLITQHMPPIFTATLASRIEKLCGVPTQEAKHGTRLDKNSIFVAPGNYHMVLSGTNDNATILLNQDPLVNSVRPAVDPLFETASSIFKEGVLGVVLTGMGADGKVGCENIKKKSGAVVIQNEASCVVYGMPRAVYESGAYDKIMNPEEIIQMLNEKVFAGGLSSSLNKAI